MVDWRVAKSLNVLFGQINDLAPSRSRVSDGTIGDADHQTRTSDHNPWITDPPGPNVVSARDFTHDPDRGADMGDIFEALRISQDPRIKYGIFNWRIFTYYPAHGYPAWTWRPYSGPNGHKTHGHLSVRSEKHLYDNTNPWEINDEGDDDMAFLPLKKGDGTGDRKFKRSDVAAIQALINRAFGTHRINEDGIYGVNTSARIVELGLPNEGSTDEKMQAGELFTGSMYGRLLDKVLARVEGQPGPAGPRGPKGPKGDSATLPDRETVEIVRP